MKNKRFSGGIFKSIKASPKCMALGGVVLVLAIWVVGACVDIFGLGIGRGSEVMVSIPKGASVDKISKILKDEGIINYPTAFKIRVKLAGDDYLFQQGGHLLGKSMSYGNIAKELTQEPDVREDETITVLIPEGYEAWQIAKTLAKSGLVDEGTFLKLLDSGEFDFDFISEIKRKENRLEGYLFPATYEIGVWESEWDIINKMLSAFESYVVPVYEEAKTDYTLDEVVTFASLVEREAANDAERKTVASVFYNRMELDMTLSSCASVQYIIKERKDILSNSDIKIKSDYNTYINKGLPIGPVASPGVNSVKAVLYPADTDYLYFAAKSDGSENVFSKTGEEHLETVRRLQGN